MGWLCGLCLLGRDAQVAAPLPKMSALARGFAGAWFIVVLLLLADGRGSTGFLDSPPPSTWTRLSETRNPVSDRPVHVQRVGDFRPSALAGHSDSWREDGLWIPGAPCCLVAQLDFPTLFLWEWANL